MKSKIRILLFPFILFLIISDDVNAFMFWNQACSFNGTPASYAGFQNSASLNITSSFSIETWINPSNSTSPSVQIILEKRTNAMSNGYTIFLSGGKVSIGTNNVPRLLGKSILKNNEWSRFTAIYNAANNLFSIYINNVFDTSIVITGAAPVSNTDSLRIGKGNDFSPFAGWLDEVRIWSKALTLAELSMYSRTTIGSSTGIYSQLKLSLTFQDNESAGSDFSLFDWTGNNGTGKNIGVSSVNLSNRPSTTIAPNDCIELDGANDFLSGNDNPDVSPSSAITMEAWIFARSNTGTRMIIHKGTATGAGVNYNLRITAGLLQATINGNSSFVSGIVIPINLWFHVAFSYNASTGRYAFFLNGEKRNEGVTSAGTINNGAENLFIGSNGGAGTFFNGFIDELRISNYVKTEVEINRFLFQSIDAANKPNGTFVNVCYNLDGYAYDNAGNGPLLTLNANADFSHPGTSDNQPVSPLVRDDADNFQQGFNLKLSEKKIPESGITGSVIDSFKVNLDTTITDLNVFIALNHNAEEELEIFLVAPNGQSVQLFDNNSLVTNSDNLITIFNDQADTSLNNNRYVSFAPLIKPKNSLNSMFAGDNSLGIWRLIINDISGTGIGRLISWGLQFNAAPVMIPTMSVKVFMQGFYIPNDSCIIDTIQIKLKQDFTPYNDVGIYGETPDDNLEIHINAYDAAVGTSYYLEIEHRNSIEIWSANPVSFNLLDGSLDYDFTVSADSAYGENQINVDSIPLRFAMFGGDVNQDDIVDAGDVTLIYNDIVAGVSGYVSSDVTGDDFVDAGDLILTYNNEIEVIGVIKP